MLLHCLHFIIWLWAIPEGEHSFYYKNIAEITDFFLLLLFFQFFELFHSEVPKNDKVLQPVLVL